MVYCTLALDADRPASTDNLSETLPFGAFLPAGGGGGAFYNIQELNRLKDNITRVVLIYSGQELDTWRTCTEAAEGATAGACTGEADEGVVKSPHKMSRASPVSMVGCQRTKTDVGKIKSNILFTGFYCIQGYISRTLSCFYLRFRSR